MQLGFGSYTFTWSFGVDGFPPPSRPMSVRGLIELAAQKELSIVQLADNVPLNTYDWAELEAIRSFADEKGVTLEVGTRGTSTEHIRNYLEIARALGSSIIRTIATEPDLSQAEVEIATVLPQLERDGIALALENHGLHTTKQLKSLFQRFDHPLIGCCLDTVNSFSALDMPDRVVDDLAPFTINLHMKDFEIRRIEHQMGFVITGTPAGSGRLDIPRILNAIRSAGRRPTCILELWTPFDGSIDKAVEMEREWFETSLIYLKSLNDWK